MNFILQPNSLFARHLQCTKVVTLNPCKRSWTTTWTWKIQTATEMTFLGFNLQLFTVKPMTSLSSSLSVEERGEERGRDGVDLDLDDQMLRFTCSE